MPKWDKTAIFTPVDRRTGLAQTLPQLRCNLNFYGFLRHKILIL